MGFKFNPLTLVFDLVGEAADGVINPSGPSTNNAIATFSGTTGLVIQSSEAHIDGSGNISTPGTIAASNFSGSSSGTNTGDQTITLTGDVNGSGTGSFSTTIEEIQGQSVDGVTGTNNVVFSNSPTLVTPALGTPSALIGTNITGTASGFTAGNINATSNSTLTTLSSLSLPGSQVSGNISGDSAGISGTYSANEVLASPNGSSGSLSVRALVAGDIPSLSATYVTQSEVGAANGVVPLDSSSKISSTYLPSTLLQYLGLWNPTTNTPTLSDLTGVNANVYQVSANYAGPVVGLSNSTMVNFLVGNLIIYSSQINQWEQTTPAAGVSSVNGAQGAITVNAINQLTSDVTTSAASGSQSEAATIAAIQGTAVSGTTGTINVVFSNSPTLVTPNLGTPSALVGTNITGTASSLTAGNINATSNSTLTTLSALSLPGSQITGNISGNADNVTGTVAVANGGTGDTSFTANQVIIAGTTSTGALQQVAAGTTGQVLTSNASGAPTWTTPASSGSVTSVGFADTSTTPIFSITNSPVTTSGTIDQTLNTQTANTVFAGPSSGSAAQPAFRGLVSADIPNNAANTSGTAANITATSNSTLTTLSALSLPGSQVSGNITGNAANITATSNSTLTTLSALSLPGSQVTGNISGNAANITATSNSTLTTLSSLSLPTSQLSGSIALTSQVSGILPVANGGTGDSSLTPYAILTGGTTSTGAVQSITGTGLAGQVLTSNGASTLPTWQAAGGGGGGSSNINGTFVLSDETVPYTTVDGSRYQLVVFSLTTAYISMANSGTAGSTTIRINQYRSGSLVASATASLSASSGLPAGTAATLSSTLSLQIGDIMTMDVVSIASAGTPSDLTVQY